MDHDATLRRLKHQQTTRQMLGKDALQATSVIKFHCVYRRLVSWLCGYFDRFGLDHGKCEGVQKELIILSWRCPTFSAQVDKSRVEHVIISNEEA